jgi:hypothetical protein
MRTSHHRYVKEWKLDITEGSLDSVRKKLFCSADICIFPILFYVRYMNRYNMHMYFCCYHFKFKKSRRTNLVGTIGRYKPPCVESKQGDQIGRKFAQFLMVYFRQLIENYRNSPSYFFPWLGFWNKFDKKHVLGFIKGDFSRDPSGHPESNFLSLPNFSLLNIIGRPQWLLMRNINFLQMLNDNLYSFNITNLINMQGKCT